MDATHDVVIIGGGPAGLSAALTLARARRSVLVIDAGEPRNAPAAHAHGLLGSESRPPLEILAQGRADAAAYGAEIVDGRVHAARRLTADDGPRFAVEWSGGTAVARRLLLASGLVDELPDVPGVRERWGRDVLHCPYCHGYEVRGRPLGVIGGTDEAVAHAQLVRQWSDDVVYFSHARPLAPEQQERLAARGIRVVDGPIGRIEIEADQLRGVRLATGQTVAREAVFVRPGFAPNSALLRDLGCASDAAGWPVVDPTGRTSEPGVWAAGNAANPRAQVITAAGEGSAAAIAINNDLVEDDVATAVRRHRATLDPTTGSSPATAFDIAPR